MGWKSHSLNGRYLLRWLRMTNLRSCGTFTIQANKLVMAKKPHIMLINVQQKKAVVIDAAIPSASNIKKKNARIWKIWGVKATVVPMVTGALKL